MNAKFTFILWAFAVLLGGCQTTPRATVHDPLATEARQRLLAPARRPICLVGVDVRTAVREIQRIFAWSPNPEQHLERDFAYVADVRVTIVRSAASLAEVMADLCNQTGFNAFREFENIGIYGAIGYEETGGRGLAFAKGGLLLTLSLSQYERDKQRYLSIGPNVVDTVPWLYHDHARLQIEELIYPDGTRIDSMGADQLYDSTPLGPLVANQGHIKSIRGTLSIQLPSRVEVRRVQLVPEDLPREEGSGHHYVRIIELKKRQAGWVLACSYGYYSSIMEEGLRLDNGHVDALDSDGRVMQGVVEGGGGGSIHSGDTYEHFDSFVTEYPSRPSAVRLTCVTESEECRIPVHFEDCRVPDIFWNPQHTEAQAQAPVGDDSGTHAEDDTASGSRQP